MQQQRASRMHAQAVACARGAARQMRGGCTSYKQPAQPQRRRAHTTAAPNMWWRAQLHARASPMTQCLRKVATPRACAPTVPRMRQQHAPDDGRNEQEQHLADQARPRADGWPQAAQQRIAPVVAAVIHDLGGRGHAPHCCCCCWCWRHRQGCHALLDRPSGCWLLHAAFRRAFAQLGSWAKLGLVGAAAAFGAGFPAEGGFKG